MASLRRMETKTLAPDPVSRLFMDTYKDHTRTAYHHEDDIWDQGNDVGSTLRKIASRRKGTLPKDHVAQVVDKRDLSSPDSWIPRNPDLLRLTGKHPINAEPCITELLDQGFITPVSLHYVRNHGKSPRIDRGNHRLSVEGLVNRPTVFTMDDLMGMPHTTVPITIVCSGNRRKEQNMVKKTVGFNWSCSGQSCNLWTGVKLSEVLERCGVDMNNARFVWFDGAHAENLPNGCYGTSIDIVTATNPFDHVILAWAQNGIPLTPDHGFPLRVIVPGFVGGRAVKWLERIYVADRSSENFYHFHDNRIMPTFVDVQLASEEGWWYKEEYVFNELSVNSAIVYPSHQETIHASHMGKYTIKGFGYSGGGRKVTRVELSFDDGATWKLCSVQYPEERYSSAPKYGKYYCWMFWEFLIERRELCQLAKDGRNMRCRAWDQSSNTQPKALTWNVLGMGNNCQYTVKMKWCEEFGMKYAEFIHPIADGSDSSGWMKPPERETAAVASAKLKRKSSTKDVEQFTMQDVEAHNSEKSAWIVVDGNVYDTTKYLAHHPGGAESILMNAGTDATEDFFAIHSEKAKVLLEDFFIGQLSQVDARSASSAIGAKVRQPGTGTSSEDGSLVALHPREWRLFELVERTRISQDTRLFKFKLQSAKHRLGLPVGYHMFCQAVVDGKTIMRAYTPVSSDDDVGTFTLCIKVYCAGVHPKFPEGGKMSQYMERMKIGEKLKVKGPMGHFEYKGRGKVAHLGKERFARRIGMLCGGTGVTPAYQVLQAIYKDAEDKTEICLLYANRTEGDILMRKELERMAAERENITVVFTVTNPKAEWCARKGRVNGEMIGECMPGADEEHFVGMCGPPLMISEACVPCLKGLGHYEEQMVLF